MNKSRFSAGFSTLAVASLSVFNAGASPLERYFSTEPYSCGNRTYISEWYLRGDTDGELVLDTYEKQVGRTDFAARHWVLPVQSNSGSINISDESGRPVWHLSGLTDDNLTALALNRKGKVRTDCSPIFQQAKTAADRFRDVITLLDTLEPDPEHASRVAPAKRALPPLKMLPELQQGTTNQEIKDKSSAFWARYRENSLARAENPSDASIIDGLDMVLASIDDQNSHRWHVDLLTEALNRRAAAIGADGGDRQAMGIADSAFCSRMAAMPFFYDWNKYLQTATGVPTNAWDETFAQRYLDLSSKCEKGRNFSDIVTRYWPQIQKANMAYVELGLEAKRLAESELTLDTVKADNWLEVSHELYNKYQSLGLDTQSINDLLEPVLKKRRVEAVPILAAHLASGLEGTDLGKIPTYCREKRKVAHDGYRIPAILQQAAMSCEKIAAETFEEAGLRLIEERRDALMALDETADALANSKFYSLDEILPRFGYVEDVFTAPHKRLTTALADAEASLEPKRRAAIAAASTAIDTIFAEVDELDRDGRASDYCSTFMNRFDQQIVELRKSCVVQINALNKRREKARCDAVWAKTKAPKGFREGSINLPFQAEPVKIDSIICDISFQNSGLKIEDNSGLIFSEYLLTNEQIIGGTPVRFSAILNKPDMKEGEWTLSEAKLNGNLLTGPNYKTSADFVACATDLRQCFRQN